MHVTGDRTVEHGLATVGFDGEGVAGRGSTSCATGRWSATSSTAGLRLEGFGRSNGCAFAHSPIYVPIQRMANISLPHGGPTGRGPRSSSPASNGVYIVGDKSWSIDMQRHNFQFTGQRFFNIENGRLAGQLKTSPTSHDDRLLGCDGGRRRRLDLALGGPFNCGKGSPDRWRRSGTAARRSSPRRERLNTRAESGR